MPFEGALVRETVTATRPSDFDASMLYRKMIWMLPLSLTSSSLSRPHTPEPTDAMILYVDSRYSPYDNSYPALFPSSSLLRQDHAGLMMHARLSESITLSASLQLAAPTTTRDRNRNTEIEIRKYMQSRRLRLSPPRSPPRHNHQRRPGTHVAAWNNEE
jgi:hypothetical protein